MPGKSGSSGTGNVGNQTTEARLLNLQKELFVLSTQKQPTVKMQI
jgi:hypothetical protein